MIRPEVGRICGRRERSRRVVVSREYFGHDQIYTVRLDSGEIVRARTGPDPILGTCHDRVRLEVDDVIAFPR